MSPTFSFFMFVKMYISFLWRGYNKPEANIMSHTHVCPLRFPVNTCREQFLCFIFPYKWSDTILPTAAFKFVLTRSLSLCTKSYS